ncbi:hypothetical protein HK103_001846 [Boothiomyces macroporosus]|uniref:Uncharacterized protein n=1 Tax=Boothiomyces macroporosus TaxID=261099 RepID=A0AAD5UAU2_9FUNG|nr:hypothetical protein HK103_001846 [Boothiomyces macroporosus]
MQQNHEMLDSSNFPNDVPLTDFNADMKEDSKLDKNAIQTQVMKLYLKANYELIKVKYNLKKHKIDKILQKLWSKEEESKKNEYIELAKEILANKKEGGEKRKAENTIPNPAKKLATSENVAFQFGPSSQITSTPLYSSHIHGLPLSPQLPMVSPVMPTISPIQTPMLSPQLNTMTVNQAIGQSLLQNEPIAAPIQKAKVQTSRVYLEQQPDGTFVMVPQEGQTTSNTTFTRQPDGSYLMVSTEIEAADTLVAPIASPKILSPILPAAQYVSPHIGSVMVSPNHNTNDFVQDLPQIASPQRILSPLLSPQLNAKQSILSPSLNNIISPLLSPQLPKYNQSHTAVISPLLSPQLKSMNSMAVPGGNLASVNSFLDIGPLDDLTSDGNSFLLPTMADQDIHPSFNTQQELTALFGDTVPYNSVTPKDNSKNDQNESRPPIDNTNGLFDIQLFNQAGPVSNGIQSKSQTGSHSNCLFDLLDPAYMQMHGSNMFTTLSSFSTGNELHSNRANDTSCANNQENTIDILNPSNQRHIQNNLIQDNLRSPVSASKTIDQHISEQWSTLEF